MQPFPTDCTSTLYCTVPPISKSSQVQHSFIHTPIRIRSNNSQHTNTQTITASHQAQDITHQARSHIQPGNTPVDTNTFTHACRPGVSYSGGLERRRTRPREPRHEVTLVTRHETSDSSSSQFATRQDKTRQGPTLWRVSNPTRHSRTSNPGHGSFKIPAHAYVTHSSPGIADMPRVASLTATFSRPARRCQS